MVENNALFVINLLVGAIFWITSLIVEKYPPKSINTLYGYRTKNSMRSKERWDFAQRYSNKLLRKAGILLIAVGLLSYPVKTTELAGTLISLVTISATMAYLVYSTEKALKEQFDNEADG